ncbi:MAG: hypothetical protein R3C32_02985 [Chloroflexota bacterium]
MKYPPAHQASCPPAISIKRKGEVYDNCDAWRKSAFQAHPQTSSPTSRSSPRPRTTSSTASSGNTSSKYLKAWRGAWEDTISTHRQGRG